MLTQNPINVTTANPSNNASASTKPAPTPVSGAPFNQFLSREKAAAKAPTTTAMLSAPPPATYPEVLSSAPAPTAPAPAPANNNNNNKQTTAAAPQHDNNADAASDGKPAASGATTAIAKTGDGGATEKSVAKDDGKDSQLDDAADAAIPLDLLALVASFNQLAQKPPAASETGTGNADLLDEADSAPHGLNALELNADKMLAADKMLPADKTAAGLAALSEPLGAPKKDVLLSDLPAHAKTEVSDASAAGLTAIDGAKSTKGSKTDDLPLTSKTGTALKDAEPAGSVRVTIESEVITTVSTEKLIAMPEANKAALSDLSAVHAPNAALLAPAALQMNQAAALPAGEKLTPAVGSAGWDQALGQKVVWMIAGGQQSATLTLNPPDLGPLQVVVHVHNDQASASFNSNQPEVRAALEAAMPKLHNMLNDAGISLASTSVGSSMQSNSQSTPNEQRQPQTSRFNNTASNTSSDLPLRSSSTPRAINNGSPGLVDTFA